jgi:hypothetical protein
MLKVLFKAGVVLVISIFIYNILLSQEDSKSEKVNDSEIFPYHNIRSIDDGSHGLTEIDIDMIGSNSNTRPNQYIAEVYDPITFLEWKMDSDMLRNASNSRKPIKWIGSPASSWQSLKWNISLLAERWPVLENVFMTENGGLQIAQQVEMYPICH